ncbi:hypothetical protein J6590_037871 [Homalodisca vitripennis]|nr:hypothetical protein J6590_037871 [Homalodisca vitripennis]
MAFAADGYNRILFLTPPLHLPPAAAKDYCKELTVTSFKSYDVISFLILSSVPGSKSPEFEIKDSCLKLISSYENVAGAADNYSFYIDGYSDDYWGRGWLCPYTAGELWVAVLEDIFPSDVASSIADKVLVHFTHEFPSEVNNEDLSVTASRLCMWIIVWLDKMVIKFRMDCVLFRATIGLNKF